MLGNVAHPQIGISMGRAGVAAQMPSWMEVWNEWEIQVVVVASFSLQVILFFFAGIRRYTVSSVLNALLWLVYLLADVVATYALGHMSSSLSKKSSGEHQLVAFWAPFLLLHLGGQDTITAYALEDNELWRRHLLNMLVQVACTGYVLYKYIIAGGGTFVPAAMLVLVAGFVKYGERIWALKIASKKNLGYYRGPRRWTFMLKIYRFLHQLFTRNSSVTEVHLESEFPRWMGKTEDCFTKKKQFQTYAFIVMTAHALCHMLVKPIIVYSNKRLMEYIPPEVEVLLRSHSQDVYWGAGEKRHTGELYRAIEVELTLTYDMLYTKAQVIHTWYGWCTHAISIVSCFAALVFFTKTEREGYSTPDIVITFALLIGACALEVASVFKATGSTWTYVIFRRNGWNWLANAILFARHQLVVVKDGRWSSSIGQFNFMSFHSHSNKKNLKGRIARLFGVQYLWSKSRCTKHAKLSPALKEIVWDLLKGEKSDIVQTEDTALESRYWARRLRGFDQSEHFDWSLHFEFQESVLIWHIATSTFLNYPAIKSKLVDKDKDMAEAVNTLSDYMMYLLVKHPDILPMRKAVRRLFDECYGMDLTYPCFIDNNAEEPTPIILDYNQQRASERTGKGLLMEGSSLADKMLSMQLGLTHRMVIIGTVWTDMLCYAAINASEAFHARQLSNGGEFLTHILVLTKYASAINKNSKPNRTADGTVEASAGHIELNVDDDYKGEIAETR